MPHEHAKRGCYLLDKPHARRRSEDIRPPFVTSSAALKTRSLVRSLRPNFLATKQKCPSFSNLPVLKKKTQSVDKICNSFSVVSIIVSDPTRGTHPRQRATLSSPPFYSIFQGTLVLSFGPPVLYVGLKRRLPDAVSESTRAPFELYI